MKRPALLYDAECRLCRFAARVVERLARPGELDVLPLQHPRAGRLLAGVPPSERLATWRIALPDGSVAGEGAGAPVVLLAIRRTRWLGRLLALVPDRLLEAVYRLVARHRGRLGRFVPDGDAPRRL